MPGYKLIIASVFCGTLITILLTGVAVSVGNDNVARVLLWQVAIPAFLAGPGPILGHDAQGNPIYEGTVIHMMAGLVGIFLGVPIYSAVCYFFIRAGVSLRARNKRFAKWLNKLSEFMNREIA